MIIILEEQTLLSDLRVQTRIEHRRQPDNIMIILLHAHQELRISDNAPQKLDSHKASPAVGPFLPRIRQSLLINFDNVLIEPIEAEIAEAIVLGFQARGGDFEVVLDQVAEGAGVGNF